METSKLVLTWGFLGKVAHLVVIALIVMKLYIFKVGAFLKSSPSGLNRTSIYSFTITFLSDSLSGDAVDCGHYLGKEDEPVTQGQCFNISTHVGVNWKDVLRKLSMNETIIRNLEEDYKHCKVVEKCYQGLLAWKEIVGPQNATSKKLCDALRLVGCSEALKTNLWKENISTNNDC